MENRAVRADQRDFLASYEAFLNQKAGGKTLAERLKPGSLALYKYDGQTVACALMGEK